MSERPGTERRKWLTLTGIGAGFLLLTGVLAFAGSGMNPLMLAGVAAFAASCLGVGLIQLHAIKAGSPDKPNTKAMGGAALLMAAACLLIGLAALGMEASEFSRRYPRWMGIAVGCIGTPFFGAGGIYGLVKGSRK